MQTFNSFLLGVLLALSVVSAIKYHNEHKQPEYSVSQAAPLPDLLQDWTDEQLEDEQVTYREAIETLKEEQRLRASK
mgnify:CR=1 FL=1